MRDGLPSRGRKGKPTTEFAATPRYHVIASRVVSPDRLEIAVRGEFEGNPAAVKRHARLVARSIATRFEVAACCDVTDAAGLLVFTCSEGAA